MKRVLVALGAVLVMAGCVSYQRIHMIEKNMPTVVHLTVGFEATNYDGSTVTLTATGSGVVISPYGHILTCAHMVSEGQREVAVRFSEEGEVLVGRVLATDDERDLALVKLDTSTPRYVGIAPSGTTVVGQDVFVIGNPMGLPWTVTAGIVSGFRRDGMLLQTDADINPGNSGGPVFNLNGQLVGIANMMRSPIPASIGLNFAVSVESIRAFLHDFEGLYGTSDQ